MDFIEFVYCKMRKHAVTLHPENKQRIIQDEKIITYIIINNWRMPMFNVQCSMFNRSSLRAVEQRLYRDGFL